MKIIRNDEMGTLTLCPVEPDEREIVDFIVANVKAGEKLKYDGRSTQPDGSIEIYLHIGGEKTTCRKKDGHVTVIRDEMVGGRRLTLYGTTEEDKNSVGCIRDMCYFATGGIVYLGNAEVNGAPAVIFTGTYCKVCFAAIIGMGCCEWKTCTACAKKCEHNYVRGPVHGGDAGDIGMGYFCDKCGRGKPKAEGEEELSRLGHHLAVERELGVSIIYKDIGLTAGQVDAIQKSAQSN